MKPKTSIAEISFDFALAIIELYKLLTKHREYVLSKQILRSSTSIGANVSEASAAPTRKDFGNKMAVASKEARETKYWLRLIHHSKLIDHDLSIYFKNCDVIINILTRIVKTTQENLKK